MQKIGGPRRLARSIGVGVLFGSLLLGFGAMASNADELPVTPATPTDGSSPTATPTPQQPDISDKGSLPQAVTPQSVAETPPYGASKPVTLETDFSRPYKAISSAANSDFSLLDDLERLIEGSYRDQNTGELLPASQRTNNYVYLSISRMENSHRVGRKLVAAAKAGVTVRVIHGVASQSNESRALHRALSGATYHGKHTGHFHICEKGHSNACLSGLHGAIMHSKILLVNHTFTRAGDPANAAIWSGSANLGGPSGERTFNNGMTIYNDKKLWDQATQMWADMSAERNVHDDYLEYVKDHASKYGEANLASNYGYTSSYATHGMFYSSLANVTIYATPIQASPTNGKDPVMNLLNRVIPDDTCRIRLQENRFKYRRIAVAQKLVQLANAGCKVSAVGFEDDLKVNRVMHCQQYIRICRPILDVFKNANQRIETAWAKPHDKTIMVDAVLKANRLNPEEVPPNGGTWPQRTKLVQAGSAALTGSNLVVSDEITTETTDPAVFDDYLQHWKAIWKSHEIHIYPY
ncbi:MAG: hypothetical protein QOJ72_294 [Nocardioidaceae bacterium]|nr:hypothetical protein [Nocardioidaceae bacterium]